MGRQSGSLEIKRKHYFVDEAGDPTLFGARGKVLVGSEGCSRFFALGLADVDDPPTLAADLATLRGRLAADPYFKDVPSMQPEQRKTALLFHAKDELPEVRREVFALLQRHAIRFSAIVRDKLAILWAVQRAFEKHEDRFLRLLWPKCSLVIDADDSREKGYGRYYTKQRPLTAAALKEAKGYRSDSPK